jgi:hypothetical protein
MERAMGIEPTRAPLPELENKRFRAISGQRNRDASRHDVSLLAASKMISTY